MSDWVLPRPHRSPAIGPSLAAALAIAVALLLPAPTALAAKVYRCPDGSYADKPCGEGQRVVTTTKRYTAVPGEDRECVARAEDAEELATGKAEGVPVAQALKRVDEAGLPYEQRTLRKKFVVKVYQTAGSPAEIRSVVEADCVTDKKSAAKAAAAEKAAADQAAAARAATASQAANAATPATTGPNRSQCDELKRTLTLLRKRQFDGADPDAMESMRNEQRDSEKQFAGLCPQ